MYVIAVQKMEFWKKNFVAIRNCLLNLFLNQKRFFSSIFSTKIFQ